MKATNTVFRSVTYLLLLLAIIWLGYFINPKMNQRDVTGETPAKKFEFVSLRQISDGEKKLAATRSNSNNGNLIEDRYIASDNLNSGEIKQGIDQIKNLSGRKVSANNSATPSGASVGADTNIEGSGVFDKIKESVLGALDSLSANQDSAEQNQESGQKSQISDSLASVEDACGANETVGQSCGGGTAPEGGVGECKAQTSLAFDYGCNYGNYPDNYNVPESQGNTSCSSTVSCGGRCYCGASVSSVCGVTKRCIRIRTGTPCQPVTCEQCCEGSAWLWDSVTGWCGCAR